MATSTDITKIKSAFFIGVGGIGISALAKMMLTRGIRVSGVNDEDSPKTLNSLREAGAEIMLLPEFQKLPELPKADLYVYSDAWIYRGPDILEDARETGEPVLSYFEALGEFAKAYKVVAVAGTHGKTTTTAMLADVLIAAGLNPTVVVGSFVKKWNSNFRKGGNEYLVVEADEYNRHFLNFHPYITVVTNIEADHLDCYKDLNDIQNAFDQLAAQSQQVILDYSKYLEFVPTMSVPGLHNRQNAAAALAVSDLLQIDRKVAQEALAQFSGTWRRLEKRGESQNGAIIYDDYAHHPTEIRASLQALRELYPRGEKYITVLFQPHLYSRTKALFKEFSECFDLADNVFLLPIYFAREAPDPSVSSEKLAQAIRLHRGEAVAFADFTEAAERLAQMELNKKDILVTMGAGEAYKVADQLFFK